MYCIHPWIILPWNLPLSLTEKIRMTLRAERNAAFNFLSFTGRVDHTPWRRRKRDILQQTSCYSFSSLQIKLEHHKIHTFALARETFSWLLLLIRKYLASLRTYFNLLVWSMKQPWRRSKRSENTGSFWNHVSSFLWTWGFLTFSHSTDRRRQFLVLLFRPCR